MHLWTSAISFAGSVVSPDRLPPQILSSKTMPAVKYAIYFRHEHGSSFIYLERPCRT